VVPQSTIRVGCSMTSRDSANAIELPLLTPAVLEACSFQNWYNSFSQHTFRSTIITLDPSHVDYLRDTRHGLHLPKELAPPSSYTSQLSDSEDDSDTEQSPSISSSSSSTPPPSYSFPQLTRTIAETIELYGGSVFPKLNWTPASC